MIIIVITVLVIIDLTLIVYNYSVHKKIETYSNLNQRITSLNVLQEFMKTLGENSSIQEKLENINDILISKYSIKYSTIVSHAARKSNCRTSGVRQFQRSSVYFLTSPLCSCGSFCEYTVRM